MPLSLLAFGLQTMDCANSHFRERRGPVFLRRAVSLGEEQRGAVAALPGRAALGQGLEELLQGGLRRA